MILRSDVLRLPLADKSVDLVFCSPPFEAARSYGINFNLRGQAWADWAVAGFMECLRVCRGLVAWNVEGQTRQFRYSATPALFMADLHRAGVHLRKPPIFKRVGIPGSGGPDWLRNDYEFIVCGTNGGKLPWSDNTAMGHPPRWAPGGAMSHRLSDGSKVNQRGHSSNSGATRKLGNVTRSHGKRPSHTEQTKKDWGRGGKFQSGYQDGDVARRPQKLQTRRKPNGERARDGVYTMPVLANPGNIIDCKVGGGLMGSKISHENEAPFPESLAEFFIRSFCPPGGIVLDPFGGSGTTLAVAKRWHRRGVSCDIRWSQCELMKRRVAEVQTMLIA